MKEEEEEVREEKVQELEEVQYEEVKREGMLSRVWDRVKRIASVVYRLLLSDTIYCVVGALFGTLLGFANYWFGNVENGIFWMLVALVCVMNLKESPR